MSSFDPAILNEKLSDWSTVAAPVDDGMLRRVAAKIGDEWQNLVQELGVPRMRIKSIIRNSADTDDDADIILEMLTSWMKRLPRAADKVRSE